jgi:hypothetical protein
MARELPQQRDLVESTEWKRHSFEIGENTAIDTLDNKQSPVARH